MRYAEATIFASRKLAFNFDIAKNVMLNICVLSFIICSLGNPLTVNAAGAVTTVTYDDRGFQLSLKDVNMAVPAYYAYDAYGRMTQQTDARRQTTGYQYDAAGRITQETAPERTLTYRYVPSGNGTGQIQTVSQDGTVVRAYSYNSSGQMASVTEKIDNADYTTSYVYNSRGQMLEKQSPSGMRITYQYTGSGLLSSMRNGADNTLLWQADAVNALGQITESTLGNGLKRVSGYDAYHLPNLIQLQDGGTVIKSLK